LIAVISAAIAFAGAGVAWYGVRQQRLISRLAVAYQTHSTAEQIVSRDSSVLRLHGVNLRELHTMNVSNNDVAYVMSVFNTGNAYTQVSQEDEVVFPDYFKRLLEVRETRHIYSILRAYRVLDDSALTDHCDKYAHQLASTAVQRVRVGG
ncbi:MAG: hypothetical protein AAFX41_18085, partial [Bacteroidota bacterium]